MPNGSGERGLLVALFCVWVEANEMNWFPELLGNVRHSLHIALICEATVLELIAFDYYAPRHAVAFKHTMKEYVRTVWLVSSLRVGGHNGAIVAELEFVAAEFFTNELAHEDLLSLRLTQVHVATACTPADPVDHEAADGKSALMAKELAPSTRGIPAHTPYPPMFTVGPSSSTRGVLALGSMNLVLA